MKMKIKRNISLGFSLKTTNIFSVYYLDTDFLVHVFLCRLCINKYIYVYNSLLLFLLNYAMHYQNLWHTSSQIFMSYFCIVKHSMFSFRHCRHSVVWIILLCVSVRAHFSYCSTRSCFTSDSLLFLWNVYETTVLNWG